MIRFANASVVALMASATFVAACDRPSPPPAANGTAEAEAFDNSAATQSIMQPKVIAESPPTPTPTPTPTAPPPLPHLSVLFAHGAALDDAARAALDRLAADPAVPPDATFVLRGSADSPGSDAANLATSRKRATAVAAYLATKGIGADRLKVIALGDRRPVAPNARLDGSDDPQGRARNRRVDVDIVAASATLPTPPAAVAVSAAPRGDAEAPVRAK